MRIGADDIRMQLGTYDGDYDDYRTIKWVPTIDGTDSSRSSFDYRSDITSWAGTSSGQDQVTLQISTRANAGDYDTRDSRLILAANNYDGSTTRTATIYVVQECSNNSYSNWIGLFANHMYVSRSTGPSGTPASGFAYVWFDSSTNTLKMKDSAGTTRSVTFS